MLMYLWADGEYQSAEDEPHSWKSDDFIVVTVPDDEDVDDYMHALHLEVNLGHNCNTRTVSE